VPPEVARIVEPATAVRLRRLPGLGAARPGADTVRPGRLDAARGAAEDPDMIRRVAIAALVVAVSWGCRSVPAAPSTSAAPPGGDGPARVLFIGNSLTEANGLPAMVESLANHDRTTRVTTASVVFGGYSLEDHWNQGSALRRIDEGGWTIVVLQQGPSALPESQQNLREWTARFDQRIRRTGARTALYMVWPESFRPEAFDAVSESYRRAAEDVGGALYPVGEAWREVWRHDPGVALYGPDGFHPTPAATYLAALVITEQVTGLSPIGLPSLVPLPAATAALLQQSAATANERFGRR
jgi:hypothetical protein